MLSGAQRFFHIGLAALHAAREPLSDCMTVVPFETAVVADFRRRRACGDDADAAGGRPAFFERGAVRDFFLAAIRASCLWFALATGCLLATVPTQAHAEAVAVRIPESASRAFPVLRSADDKDLAHGEQVQTLRGDRVHSRLTFRFKNGSLYDETVVYSQSKVFRLLSYRLVQRGASFPSASDVSFDRATGRYRAKVDDDESDGRIDIPPDVHNGMTGVLLRNLPGGVSARGHMIAFTPKPRILKTELAPEGEDRFVIGGAPHKATRYLIKLELGGVTGVVASALGKAPEDVRYWLTAGPAPTFLKFEGAMFLNGPLWRIELGVPQWPR